MADAPRVPRAGWIPRRFLEGFPYKLTWHQLRFLWRIRASRTPVIPRGAGEFMTTDALAERGLIVVVEGHDRTATKGRTRPGYRESDSADDLLTAVMVRQLDERRAHRQEPRDGR